MVTEPKGQPVLRWTDIAESGPETLSAIVEANFAVCYEWDLRTDHIRFWGGFEELLGLSPARLPGTINGWLELLHPEDRSRVAAKNEASIRGLRPYRDEYRMIHVDGSHVHISDSGHVLTDNDGRACRMVGGIRDVTEERMARQALEEKSVALRVILDQRNRDKAELEQNMHENMRMLVIPALERIRRSLGSRPEAEQLTSLCETLEEIVDPFARRVVARVLPSQRLTQREVEIVDLIRKGKTSQEIADHLFLSHATVCYHRTNIRRKLNLSQKGDRLATYLGSLVGEEPLEAPTVPHPAEENTGIQNA